MRKPVDARPVEFAASLAALAFIAFLALSVVMPLLQAITAVASSALLNALGVSSQFVPGDPPGVTFAGLLAAIIPLCVGDFEIAFLVAAILSTWDRPRLYRLEGAVAAFVFVMLFNPVRIALTLASWQWFGFAAADFLHSLGFRLTLVVTIVGFYALWYSWPRFPR
jgi:exosortase/archaeosortase family protein